MPEVTTRSIHTRRVAVRLIPVLVLAASVAAATPTAAPNPPASAAAPAENPLRTADDATQRQAREEAWVTFQRTCRPCHGNLGAGDGPYGLAFTIGAADLRRPSRDVANDAVRFTRIHDGAASLTQRPWESSMPAFGAELDDRQIWGLVLLLDDFGKEGSGLDPSGMGADTYAARCAVCHGTTGAGDGPLASELRPAPRNLARGAYRIRSTEYGQAPLDVDVLGVIARGMGNTAMGRFIALGTQRVEDVGAHVRSLAPALFAATPTLATGSPMPARPLSELAARGRVVYEEAKCAECHGNSGRGDGPARATLTDDTGRRSVPTNLTKRWRFKGSGDARDVFRTLTTGFNGTPMKSYVSSVSGDDRWALAHYIERVARIRAKFSPTVQAGILHEPIPLDVAADIWKAVPTAPVLLGPQVEIPPYWTDPAIDTVDMKVAVNDQDVGILLIWDDASRDVQTTDTPATTTTAAFARDGAWQLTDRIALQFPETLDPKNALPPLFLGSAAKPVVRWSWSADRMERGEQGATIERIAGAEQPPTTVSDAAAVRTTASYLDGQWRVLMIGKRPPKTQATMAVAVHAWDGASGEAGRWQSLSSWLTVNLR